MVCDRGRGFTNYFLILLSISSSTAHHLILFISYTVMHHIMINNKPHIWWWSPRRPPRKFTVNGLAKAFADFNKFLKKFENMDPYNERFPLTERNVHGTLSDYKQIYDEKKHASKPSYSWKKRHLLKKSLRQVLPEVFPKKLSIITRVQKFKKIQKVIK